MGAVGEGGALVVNHDVVAMARVVESDVDAAMARERAVVERRVRALREGHPALDLRGRAAIVVDDGVATGATARAACAIARARGADPVVLAVPVAAPDALADFGDADTVVCLAAPADFMSVGMYYSDFRQVADEEVIDLLRPAR